MRTRFEAIKPGNKNRMEPAEILDIVARTLHEGRASFLDSLRAFPIRTSYATEVASFCMLVKPGVFQEYGGFDEDFFPRGYEDKWWFLRQERDGRVCMVANRAFVFHFGNISSDGPGFFFPDVMKANEALFASKRVAMDLKLSV
jgi:GT2 family glycosyltransferase